MIELIKIHMIGLKIPSSAWPSVLDLPFGFKQFNDT